jgi:hypothetical protein
MRRLSDETTENAPLGSLDPRPLRCWFGAFAPNVAIQVGPGARAGG